MQEPETGFRIPCLRCATTAEGMLGHAVAVFSPAKCTVGKMPWFRCKSLLKLLDSEAWIVAGGALMVLFHFLQRLVKARRRNAESS